MTTLRSRGAALEYWFAKVQAPGLAFLVDLIVRRRSHEAEIRLSYWLDGRGTVTHARTTEWAADAHGVRVGAAAIIDGRVRGTSGEATWDLDYRASRWLRPARLMGAMRVGDLQIESAPDARFGGTVRIADREFSLEDAPGLVSHYWGRRLPDRWIWLALNDGEREVESIVARSRLWGLPWPQIDFGYVYAKERDRRTYVLSLVNGIVTASVNGSTVHIRARSARRTVDLVASSAPALRNDLGEGISQTLLGGLTVDGADAGTVAGVETRGWA